MTINYATTQSYPNFMISVPQNIHTLFHEYINTPINQNTSLPFDYLMKKKPVYINHNKNKGKHTISEDSTEGRASGAESKVLPKEIVQFPELFHSFTKSKSFFSQTWQGRIKGWISILSCS